MQYKTLILFLINQRLKEIEYFFSNNKGPFDVIHAAFIKEMVDLKFIRKRVCDPLTTNPWPEVD